MNRQHRRTDGGEELGGAESSKASRGAISYIFICEHYQWFYGQDGSTSWYANWKDFCDQYGVDLALSGNNHIYLRTHPLYNDQVVPNGRERSIWRPRPPTASAASKPARSPITPISSPTPIPATPFPAAAQVKTIGCVLVKVGAAGDHHQAGLS